MNPLLTAFYLRAETPRLFGAIRALLDDSRLTFRRWGDCSVFPLMRSGEREKGYGYVPATSPGGERPLRRCQICWPSERFIFKSSWYFLRLRASFRCRQHKFLDIAGVLQTRG